MKLIAFNENCEFDKTDLEFDENLTCEDINKYIDLIVSKKIDNKFVLKNLSIDNKMSLVKYLIDKNDLTNDSLVTNIILLIKPYNTLNEEFFKNPYVMFNSIEEFLDLKIKLQNDLNCFKHQLMKYYISLMKSLNKFNFSPLDEYQTLPDLYISIFSNIDLLTLGSLLASEKDLNVNECPYLENSEIVFTNLLVNHFEALKLLNNILN